MLIHRDTLYSEKEQNIVFIKLQTIEIISNN